MAMGRPVVCTRTTGQTDTVIDGVTGVYVPPGDADALRSTIERCSPSPNCSDSSGPRPASWAVEHADIDRYADRIAAVLDSI